MFRILVVAFALCLPLQASWAAMIDGQKCVSMVSKQINPITKVITYVCRTVDGGVASGPTVEYAKMRVPPKVQNGNMVK
jgi:hypothetical protein